jgi:hypothetical protein
MVKQPIKLEPLVLKGKATKVSDIETISGKLIGINVTRAYAEPIVEMWNSVMKFGDEHG